MRRRGSGAGWRLRSGGGGGQAHAEAGAGPARDSGTPSTVARYRRRRAAARATPRGLGPVPPHGRAAAAPGWDRCGPAVSGGDAARRRAGPGRLGPSRVGGRVRLRRCELPGPRSPWGRPASRPWLWQRGALSGPAAAVAALGTASLLRCCGSPWALPVSAALRPPEGSLVRSYSIFAGLRRDLRGRGDLNLC